jgi:hypothetical protein
MSSSSLKKAAQSTAGAQAPASSQLRQSSDVIGSQSVSQSSL